jgi:precorrin-2/cobalt-factor-2 C20-methyltransferase
MVRTTGTLHGVGVGPGDPELMTVKAARLINQASVIAYLTANGTESTALNIAKPFLTDKARHIVIDMPMRPEREFSTEAYDSGAARIAQELQHGNDVVMLCEGDPFFYGSFIYVFSRLSSTYDCQVIPGVTALTASAAALGKPLSSRDAVVKVVPATLPDQRLKEELRNANTIAIIKVGRHFMRVRHILNSLDLHTQTYVVIKASHADQSIHALEDLSLETVPYFSTLLVFLENK